MARRGKGRRPVGAVSRLRLALAQAAARIMAEDQAVSHLAARDKALRGMRGPIGKQDLPEPAEIEAELQAYLALFSAGERQDWLSAQRRLALQAMEFFTDFSPRLAGAVLRGTSTASSAVVLHLFTENVDDVVVKLINLGAPHRILQRRYQWPGGEERDCPVIAMQVEDRPLELVIFQPRDLLQPPRSRLTGRGVERADARVVKELLDGGPGGG